MRKPHKYLSREVKRMDLTSFYLLCDRLDKKLDELLKHLMID